MKKLCENRLHFLNLLKIIATYGIICLHYYDKVISYYGLEWKYGKLLLFTWFCKNGHLFVELFF